MFPSSFEYFAPRSLEEALLLLGTFGEDAKLLAGGQSLLAIMKLRLARPRYIIDLGRIPGQDAIRENSDGSISIGMLATQAQIKASPLLREKCPILPQTAAVVGDVQVRNRGTLAGSLAHADPAADMPAAMLALQAEMKAFGSQGERWIPAERFFLTMYTTALQPNEILTEVRIPLSAHFKMAYLKNAPRPSDFAVVGVGTCFTLDPPEKCQEIRIGLTGLTDRPFRAKTVEQKLQGQPLTVGLLKDAARWATDGIDVIGNIHASPEFRTHLAQLYIVRTIQAALA